MEHTASTRNDMQNAAQQQQDQHGHEDMPLIDALASSDRTLHPSTVTRKTPSETLRKMKAQQTLIQQLQKQLQQTSDALEDSEQNKAELNELLLATLNSPPPTRPLETPGPHRLQARAQRPEDIAYQERLQEQSEREQEQNAHTLPDTQPNTTHMMLERPRKTIGKGNEGYQYL